ncbi:MAG: carbamoyltransferase, partial [Candidatus Paceibacteria bacterium]
EERDKWVSDRFYDLMGPKRQPESSVLQHHKDLAAALQNRLEEIVLAQLRHARKEFGLSRLCLSGGVALNCSLNGKIEASGIFDEIFVQPASGDSGNALGACYLSAQKLGQQVIPSKTHDFYLGSNFTNEEIEDAFEQAGIQLQHAENIFALTATKLAAGKIVGWFQGSAEFGPRALGNRSILCRPYPAEMRDHLNARVKFREYFRPFAPSVLAERAEEYFDLGQESPHMLIACKVLPSKKDEVPAVVHVDDSCRVQTVKESNNLRFRRLIEAFDEETNTPVVLNTSFNVKGQPIVNTPLEAIKCFQGTNIDFLAVGDYYAEKADA